MEFETVLVKREGGIAIIMLNRPERLNAINSALIRDLADAVEYVSKDYEARVVVLTGAGRAFCAGGDFRYSDVRSGQVNVREAEDVREMPGGGLAGYSQGRVLSILHKKVIRGLIEIEKPTIAMINGDAVGGGFEFTLACDMRVASEKARFGVGFTRIGLTPGQGMPWLLPRIVGLGHALELILMADFWSAADGYRIGLLNKVLPQEKLETEGMAMARRLADGPPVGLRLSKLQIYMGLGMDLTAGLAFSGATEALSLKTEDHVEGIQAFAEKRKPVYKDR